MLNNCNNVANSVESRKENSTTQIQYTLQIYVYIINKYILNYLLLSINIYTNIYIFV